MVALKRRMEQEDRKSVSVVDYKNLDEREYEGRLIYVADLGIQPGGEYKGEPKPDCQQLSLGIEIIGESVQVEDEDGNVEDRPRLLWTRSFNIYSKLTEKGKELEFYQVFQRDAEAGKIPLWEQQLGKPVSVLIKNKVVKKDGEERVYDEIASISPIPEKYQEGVGEATLTPCVGDADDPENACTKALFGLPKWLYDRRIVEGDSGGIQGGYDEDDDVPF